MTDNLHILYGDVRTKHRMNLPHRRVDDLDALDQDVTAAVGLDKVWSQEVSRTKDALVYRRAALAKVQQLADAGAGGRFAACRALVPGPPVLNRRRTIEHAATRNGDVLLLKSINQR